MLWQCKHVWILDGDAYYSLLNKLCLYCVWKLEVSLNLTCDSFPSQSHKDTIGSHILNSGKWQVRTYTGCDPNTNTVMRKYFQIKISTSREAVNSKAITHVFTVWCSKSDIFDNANSSAQESQICFNCLNIFCRSKGTVLPCPCIVERQLLLFAEEHKSTFH